MDKPDYLKTVLRESKHEEYEASKKAVDCYKNNYDYYKDSNWQPTPYRMLLSIDYSKGKKGFCLCKDLATNDPFNDSIDLSGDILVGKSSICPTGSHLDEVFKEIQHTHGNFMPWPEGGNKSGGGSTYNSSDSYESKLDVIKKLFSETSSVSAPSEVRAAIIESRKGNTSIGKKFPKKCIDYWIITEWVQQGASWDVFVREHHLIDYVDADYNIRTLPEDNYHSLLMIIKLIVQRGYRIHKGFYTKWNKQDAANVCNAFKAVGLPQDPDEAHGLPYTIIGEWEE